MNRREVVVTQEKKVFEFRQPASANPYAKLAAVVVFPTPPLPDVTVTTLPLLSDGSVEKNLQGQNDSTLLVDELCNVWFLPCGRCNAFWTTTQCRASVCSIQKIMLPRDEK
jgi:hypothetical protein